LQAIWELIDRISIGCARSGKEEKISTTSIASDQAAKAGVSVSMHQLTDPIALERKGIKKKEISNWYVGFF
jgi:hypothetical protein